MVRVRASSCDVLSGHIATESSLILPMFSDLCVHVCFVTIVSCAELAELIEVLFPILYVLAWAKEPFIRWPRSPRGG